MPSNSTSGPASALFALKATASAWRRGRSEERRMPADSAVRGATRGTRRGKRSRTLRRLGEAVDRYGPDTSIAVDTFDDDSTIDRLGDLTSVWREGFLMRNASSRTRTSTAPATR